MCAVCSCRARMSRQPGNAKVWDKNPDLKLGMLAYLEFPLNFPDNQPFGTLCIFDNKERLQYRIEADLENSTLVYTFVV